MCASNSHSYTHLIQALGIVRKPTVWGIYNFKISWHTWHWPAYCNRVYARTKPLWGAIHPLICSIPAIHEWENGWFDEASRKPSIILCWWRSARVAPTRQCLTKLRKPERRVAVLMLLRGWYSRSKAGTCTSYVSAGSARTLCSTSWGRRTNYLPS